MSELAPLVVAQHGAFYLMRADDEEPLLQADRQLRPTASARGRRNRFRARRRARRAVRAREAAGSWSTTCRSDYLADRLGARRGVAARHHRPAGALRRRRQGGHRARVVRTASAEIHLLVPRPAHRDDRRSCSTRSRRTMRTEELLKQSQSLADGAAGAQQQEELRETNTELEQQAATLQASEELLQSQQEELQQTNEELERKRGSSPSRSAGREQEPRDRASAHGARGESRAARADLEVQVASSSPTCRTSCARRSTRC